MKQFILFIKKWWHVNLVVTVVLVVLGIFLYYKQAHTTAASDGDVVAFAECLSEKGLVMYGADWCEHCQNQKKIFGEEAFEAINYVNCDFKQDECVKKGVASYPVWYNGSRYLSGVQSFSQLAGLSGCLLSS